MASTASPRERLLEGAIESVAHNGIGELTLRGLAPALGTSHRMLIHHFGSKHGLLVEIVRAVEARERETMRQQLPAAQEPGEGTPGASAPDQSELARAWWKHISDPSLWPNARLFFELYGQALQGREHTASLLDGIVEDWVEPVAALLVERGLSPSLARAHARLGVAVTRGLLLDLLATGDIVGVDQAMDAFIDAQQAALAARPAR